MTGSEKIFAAAKKASLPSGRRRARFAPFSAPYFDASKPSAVDDTPAADRAFITFTVWYPSPHARSANAIREAPSCGAISRAAVSDIFE